MRKRALCLLLILSMLLCMVPPAMAADAAANNAGSKQPVVYIPLDNRPFNDERVRAMAESLNIELIMPDEDLYATRLDGQELNENGTQYGSREALFTWLQEQAAVYDTFILSLDQLLSGGLMNSRCMTENQTLVFGDGSTMTEYEVIDYIKELSQDHQVYIIDSVMRLATSCDYGGFRLSHYNVFHAYGNVARPQLSGSQLTVDNIVKNYKYYQDGSTMAYQKAGLTRDQLRTLLSPLDLDTDTEESLDPTAAEVYLRREAPENAQAVSTEEGSADAELNEASGSALSLYLSIRERKLRLSDYAMSALCGLENVHYLLGIDDSSSGNNIQTNELALLSGYLGSNDIAYSSLDGLAQAALAKLFCLSNSVSSPNVSVTYLDDASDQVLSFNCSTPQELVEQAMDYFGGAIVTEDPDLSVVVLTASNTAGGQTRDTFRLVNLLNENEANQIPTIFIDLTQEADETLNEMLLRNCHLGMLLSYSGRPEMPNSVIFGISQGLARYHSLTISGFQTQETQSAHLRNLTMALVTKLAFSDDAYATMYQTLESYGLNPLNFVTENETINQILTSEVQTAAQPLLENLASSNFITSLAPYSLGSITGTEVQSCSYPWLRQMEIDCVVTSSFSAEPYDLGEFHHYYVDGVSETEFWPEASLTREQATKLLISAAGLSVSDAADTSFQDVSLWARSYVAAAQDRGYINGYPDGSFRGENTITRAEFVTILANYVKKEGFALPSATKASFSDVARGLTAAESWYAENVYLLADADIIHGYPDGTFGPERNITRAEAVTLLNRLFHREEEPDEGLLLLQRFSDVPVNWQYPYIQEASISHFAK